MADPQLRTCLNWDATLTRLDRTGVVKLMPAEEPKTPPPPLPHESVERASLNLLKKAGTGKVGKGSVRRISEPKRAAKTVQGAAAVAAAVARAERITERTAPPKQPKK